MQSRLGVPAHRRSSSYRTPKRWCVALVLALAVLAMGAQTASATTERPGIKPQWTYQQFALNDRMTASVNVQSGNLDIAARDIDVGGNLGPQADLSRFYNSRGDINAVTDIGYGWLTNAGPDVRLAVAGSVVTFYGPSGFQSTFTSTGGGQFTIAAGIGAKLTENTGTGTYELWMYRQNVRYEFSAALQLTSEKDLSGNTLTDGYTSGALTSLVSQQGVTDTITETSGMITGASAPPSSAARTWGYGRDANGNLHTYTGPDGLVTTYTYAVGTNHLITQIDDPEARRAIIGYDGSGRATSVEQVTNNTTNAGDTTTFAYSPTPVTVSGVTYDGKTVETDANGHATTFYYETNDGTVLRTDDPLGHVHYGSYTTNDDPATTQDALSNTTKHSYTTAGGTCSLTPAGELYRPCKTTSARLIDSTDTYGDATNPFLPTITVDGRNVTTNLQYDASVGLVNQVTDGNAKITTFTHDPTTGNLTKVTNPNAFGVTFTYRPDGSPQNINSDDFSSNMGSDFDTAYRVVCSIVESTGGSMITYDDYDRPTYVDFNGDCAMGSHFSHSSRTYDKSGNVTSVITYDSSLVPVVIASTTYTYDKKNRLTQEAQTAPFAATTTYTYDGADNLKTIVNAGGTTTYNYDAADRLTSIVEPGPNTTSFTYDAADNLSTKTYPNGVVETYTYDADNNITRIIATKSATTLLDLAYTYVTIPAGAPTDQRITVRNRVSSHDAVDSTTQYYYDSNGWLTEARTYNTSTLAAIKDYKWTYDVNGNRTSQQIDGGTVNTATYYANSDRVKVGGMGTCTDTFSHGWSYMNDLGTGVCSAWAYNDRNQVTSIANASTSDSVGYSGDDNSNIASTATDKWTNDQLGVSRKITSTTSYDYLRDTTGQHLGQRNGTTRYYYVTDALGTVLEVTDATGAIVNDYTYDAWGYPRTTTGQTTNEIPFRYAGAQWILSVYHLGARYYDPRYGHFTQPDPESTYDEPGMGSRYAYANDDPVARVDPGGQWPKLIADVEKATVKFVYHHPISAAHIAYFAIDGFSVGGLTIGAGVLCLPEGGPLCTPLFAIGGGVVAGTSYVVVKSIQDAKR